MNMVYLLSFQMFIIVFSVVVIWAVHQYNRNTDDAVSAILGNLCLNIAHHSVCLGIMVTQVQTYERRLESLNHSNLSTQPPFHAHHL